MATIEESIVHIEVAKRSPAIEGLVSMFHGVPRPFGPMHKGLGSGVVWRPSGFIITNAHVVEDAVAITVKTSSGADYSASYIARDTATDIALIKVEAPLAPAPFGDSDLVAIGSRVYAIGSPFGFQRSITSGIVSAKGRSGIGTNTLEDFIQTDASINPGNSGGALVDESFKVIGINSLIVSRGQGIGFAIASNLAQWSAEHLLQFSEPRRPWIGVGMQPLTPAIAVALGAPAQGVLVSQVVAAGPSAGVLRAGDVITAIGSRPTDDPEQLVRELLRYEPGQAAQLSIVRSGTKMSASVNVSWQAARLPRLPIQDKDPGQSPIGLGLVEHDAGSRVEEVDPESRADLAGIIAGDVIAEMNRQSSPSPQAVLAAAAKGDVLVLVQRGAGAFYTMLRR